MNKEDWTWSQWLDAGYVFDRGVGYRVFKRDDGAYVTGWDDGVGCQASQDARRREREAK